MMQCSWEVSFAHKFQDGDLYGTAAEPYSTPAAGMSLADGKHLCMAGMCIYQCCLVWDRVLQCRHMTHLLTERTQYRAASAVRQSRPAPLAAPALSGRVSSASMASPPRTPAMQHAQGA